MIEAPPVPQPDTAADRLAHALAALQADGAAQAEALRWLHIQALARRAQGVTGATRLVLDDKLAALVAQCQQAMAPRRNLAPPVPAVRPLADLLAHVDAQADNSAWGGAPPARSGQGSGAGGRRSAPQDLKAVRAFRSTWSRLRLDQRLQQALATVPEQAGPLNTPRLLHQALCTMRQASPDYLQHFMVHVESLLALEALSQPAVVEPGKPAAKVAAKTAGKPAAKSGTQPGKPPVVGRSRGKPTSPNRG